MKLPLPSRPRPSGRDPRRSRRLLSALTTLVLLGCTATASAQVPRAILSQRATLNLTNHAIAVEIAGNIAYVADAAPRLNVVDIADPGAPKIIGGIAMAASARDIFISGNLAYVAARTAGLQIFDVSTPANPTLIKTFDTPNEAWAVEVVGNIAYLANGTTGLHIIDVTDPANPVQLGRYDSPGIARDVAIRGNLAYVADEDPGIQVVDISNPSVPVRRANYNTPDWAVGIQIVGDVAYVADDTAGLVILDVQNPVPRRLGGADTDGLLSSIHVVGNLAYVSGGSPRLIAFDISNPSGPIRLGAYSTPASGTQVKGVGKHVFLANGSEGLQVLDVRTGFLQELVTARPSGVGLTVGKPYPLEFAANSGLPLTIQVEGPVQLAGGVLTVTNLDPVRIIIEQPGNAEYLPFRAEREFNVPTVRATQLAAYFSSGWSEDFQVIGNTAWIATGPQGLVALDISDLRGLFIRSRLPIDGFANKVQVVGKTAYIAAENAGLVIADISNPTNLVQLASVAPRGESADVQVRDGIAYVADRAGGLAIISVTNPAAPARLNPTTFSTNVESVFVAGNRAYLSRREEGMTVVDVTDPTAPVQLGAIQDGTDFRSMQVLGDLACVAGGVDGFVLYDVADPTQIRRLGQLSLKGAATSVRVAGSRAYVCDSLGGVVIADISNPTQPKSLDAFLETQGAWRVEVTGDRAYVLGLSGQFRILDFRYGIPQEIAWAVPATHTVGTSVLPITAPSTAGLPPVFSVVRGPARIEGTHLVFTGVGRVVIRAEQAGNEIFLPTTSTFSVLAELPELRVDNVDGEVVVSWPAGITNAILQGTASLEPGNAWSTATLPRSESNGEVHVRPGNSALQFFRLQGFTGDAEPLQLTGWNRDVVLENTPTRKASAVDSFGAAWFEAGLMGYLDGLPTNRTVVSKLDETIRFELQPYTGSNVLALTTARRTNSLELARPKAFSRLHVLAHSAGGGGNGQLRIHYADGSVSTNVPFVAPDWWDGSFGGAARNPAIDNLARSATASSFSHDFVNPGFSLHQTDIDLTTGPNAGKVITRLEFVRNLSAEVTCIFAVSGVPMPPAP